MTTQHVQATPPGAPQDLTRILVKGARENNLQNVDLDIPRNAMVVFTGLSGSGKSSLAFDTIFAEGQRRYVESLSAYARMFLGQVDKPDVDFIEGLHVRARENEWRIVILAVLFRDEPFGFL